MMNSARLVSVGELNLRKKMWKKNFCYFCDFCVRQIKIFLIFAKNFRKF